MPGQKTKFLSTFYMIWIFEKKFQQVNQSAANECLHRSISV